MGIFYKLFGPSPQVLARKKDVQGLIKVLKKEEDENVRVDAIAALGMIGDSRTIEPLINALKDYNKLVRHKAANILKGKTDPRIIEPFIDALKDKDQYVRNEAIEGLGRIGDVRVVMPLINDRSWPAEKALKEAIGKIKDKQAIEQLQQILVDNSINLSSDIKDALKVTLFELGWEPQSKSEKARLLINKGDWELDEMVSLGEGAVSKLIQAIRKKDAWASQEIKALGMIGDKRAIKPLIEKIIRDRYTRYEAAEALGMIRNWNSQELELLINALSDKEWGIQESAVVALGMIGDLRSAEAVIDWLFKFEAQSGYLAEKEYSGGAPKECFFGKLETKNLFGDYAQHINYSSQGFVSDSYVTGMHTNWVWSVDESNKAVKELCNIQTSISNNILHKVVSRPTISVTVSEPDGHKNLNLRKQKMMAKKELEKRENPPYEPTVFLDKQAWKL